MSSGKQQMARAYAARLGCIAFVFGLVRHMLNGVRVEQTLVNALGMLLIFSVVGMVIGSIVEELVRQSVEANFRNKVEKYRQRSETTTVKQN
jgi:hypothetical protein